MPRVFLVWASLSLAWSTVSAGADRAIDCSGPGDQRKFEIAVGESELVLREGKKTRTFPVTSRRVEGTGVHARTILELSGGRFSYADTYGCISEAELSFKKGVFRRKKTVADLKCVYRGGPTCAS